MVAGSALRDWPTARWAGWAASPRGFADVLCDLVPDPAAFEAKPPPWHPGPSMGTLTAPSRWLPNGIYHKTFQRGVLLGHKRHGVPEASLLMGLQEDGRAGRREGGGLSLSLPSVGPYIPALASVSPAANQDKTRFSRDL